MGRQSEEATDSRVLPSARIPRPADYRAVPVAVGPKNGQATPRTQLWRDPVFLSNAICVHFCRGRLVPERFPVALSSAPFLA